MNAGISACGLTRVWNSPSTSPPRTLTAPISVIIDPPAAEPPVVSRSTTQKVMSRSGRPSSSKLRCASQRVVPGVAAPRRSGSRSWSRDDARRGHRQPRDGARHIAATREPHEHRGPRSDPALALRRLRQPDPVRRQPHAAYDRVLALRPRRRPPGRADRGPRRDGRVRSPAAGAAAPTRSSWWRGPTSRSRTPDRLIPPEQPVDGPATRRRRAVRAPLSVVTPTLGDMTTRIDCDTCVVRGLACHDCVVTVLLGPPPELELRRRGAPHPRRARRQRPGAAAAAGAAGRPARIESA